MPRAVKAIDPKTKPPAMRTDADALTLPDGEHSFGSGLLLKVEGGSRLWRTKIQVGGKRRPYRIGPLSAFDVEAARAKSIDVHRRAKGGRDVWAEQRAEEGAKIKTPTFGEHATAFMAQYLPTLKNENHRDKWEGSLKNHVEGKLLWRLPVDQVMVKDVLEVLEPIWNEITPMANEVRYRIEMILDDAANRGFRSADVNPARWTKALQHSLGKKRPESGQTRGSMASVDYEDLPALMVRLRDKQTQSARGLYATALSVLRTQEIVRMRKCELDLDAEQPTWSIPHERFKISPHKKDPFIVPLAPQFVAILREQIGELEQIYGADRVDYIWPSSTAGTRGGKPPKNPWMSHNTMLKYLKESMGVEATVHGFRASFISWTDDQFLEGHEGTPKYHKDAIAFCKAAKNPSGKTMEKYRRSKLMLAARVVIMRDWANHCAPPLEKSNVTPIRQAQAA